MLRGEIKLVRLNLLWVSITQNLSLTFNVILVFTKLRHYKVSSVK